MIEYDVDVHVECDGCGCSLGDSSMIYCYDCAKKNGIEVENAGFENIAGGDNRNLQEIIGAEKRWRKAVNSTKKEVRQ